MRFVLFLCNRKNGLRLKAGNSLLINSQPRACISKRVKKLQDLAERFGGDAKLTDLQVKTIGWICVLGHSWSKEVLFNIFV